MKRLIVNADDLGADEERNSGIFEAIEAGEVTSVSILPNGTALEDAVSRIRASNRNPVSYGIHFNLSEGKPLSPGLRRLVGPEGFFLGKLKARQVLLSGADPELENEIRREFNAQFSRLIDFGIPLDHLDGHQHVHIFPAVSPVLASAALEHGISWIRIPDEPPAISGTETLSPAEIEEAAFFSSHAQRIRLFFLRSGLSAPDHFRGLVFKGKLPSSHWPDFLAALPEGLTELMVHPGHTAHPGRGPFSAFSTRDREGELQSLIDGKFRSALLQSGVELTTFPRGTLR